MHHWGGHRGNLNRAYAPHSVKPGFLVMLFDLRSWIESDGFSPDGNSLVIGESGG